MYRMLEETARLYIRKKLSKLKQKKSLIDTEDLMVYLY